MQEVVAISRSRSRSRSVGTVSGAETAAARATGTAAGTATAVEFSHSGRGRSSDTRRAASTKSELSSGESVTQRFLTSWWVRRTGRVLKGRLEACPTTPQHHSCFQSEPLICDGCKGGTSPPHNSDRKRCDGCGAGFQPALQKLAGRDNVATESDDLQVSCCRLPIAMASRLLRVFVVATVRCFCVDLRDLRATLG